MRKKILKLPIFVTVFFFLLSVVSSNVLAAGFTFNPSTTQVNKGDQVSVKINLDTSGKQINASEAMLSFNTAVLEFKGATFTSLFPFNTHSVTENLIFISSSEDDGTSYYQGSGQWATLNFEAKGTGTSEIRFTQRSGIYEIGTRENVLSVSSLPVARITVVEPGTGGGDGGGGDDGGGTTPATAPTCHATSPASNPTNLRAASGPKVGQIALTWDRAADPVTHYSISYGLSSNNYIYGATNIGNTNQFVVSALTPGRLYYFSVLAWQDCASSGYSNEASAKGYYVVVAGSKTTPTPVPTQAVEEPAEGFEPISQVLPSVDEDLSAIAASPTPTPAYEAEVVTEDNGGGLGGWIKGNLAYVLGGLAALIFIIALLVLLLPGSSDEDDWQPPVDDGGENPQPMDNTLPAQENEPQGGSGVEVSPPPPPLPTE